MINIPPIKPTAEISTELLPEISKTWKIGHVLNATVESGGEALTKILLRIGSQQVEARSPVPLKTGEAVRLLVKSLGDTPLLSIIGSADRSQQAASKLRSVIAQQQDIGGLVKLVQQLQNSEQLSAPLRNQLQTLLRQLPSSEQLSNSTTLKSAIQNSGVFLEPRLLQHPDRTQVDLKSTLLKLSQAITKNELPVAGKNSEARSADPGRAVSAFLKGDINMRQLVSTVIASLNRTELTTLQQELSGKPPLLPVLPALLVAKLPQLLQHIQQQPNTRQLMDNLLSLLKNLPAIQELKSAVDHAIAKITSQQLIPLTRDADSPLLLFLDLPVKDKDMVHVFHFRIEEEKNSAEKNHGSWSVTINFDMPPLGPVQARLHLIENQISTVLQAEKPATVSTIQQNIGLLQNALAGIGLQVAKLDVIAGRPPEAGQFPGLLSDSVHILDEKA